MRLIHNSAPPRYGIVIYFTPSTEQCTRNVTVRPHLNTKHNTNSSVSCQGRSVYSVKWPFIWELICTQYETYSSELLQIRVFPNIMELCSRLGLKRLLCLTDAHWLCMALTPTHLCILTPSFPSLHRCQLEGLPWKPGLWCSESGRSSRPRCLTACNCPLRSRRRPSLPGANMLSWHR